jgi:hypothetical protein
MTVAELIKKLKEADPLLEVSAWDGDYQHLLPVVKVHIEDDRVWLETKA